MSGDRHKSEKTLVASYAADGTYEVWHLRFNRGSKQHKPVKFFASLEWKSKLGGAKHGGLHWDFASEAEAESYFASDIAQNGGALEPISPKILQKLREVGYAT